MESVTRVFGTIAYMSVEIECVCMLLRAVLSFFADPDGVFYNFVGSVTEPLIIPIRKVFDRFGWFGNMPLDMPFLVTFILLDILGTLLGIWF